MLDILLLGSVWILDTLKDGLTTLQSRHYFELC